MLIILINILKIAFLLGFIILIHECGHLFMAKWCKVKVKEFAVGFGPAIWKRQGKYTKYSLRLIPLGGFTNMLGEEERSEEEGSFNKAGIIKKILILLAGGVVNILFGLIIYFIVAIIFTSNISDAFWSTVNFSAVVIDSLKQLFSGTISVNDLMGPVRSI
ncbi:MAG: site-2 protease family protein [Firmicutes bacterium]|nr:site-2 protease family protein [Bacillota bacterium]